MKNYFILLVILVASLNSYSQVRIGFKAGAGLSTVVYTEKEKIQWWEWETHEKWRMGYYVGALSKIDVSEK
jgi:hypothetical protein